MSWKGQTQGMGAWNPAVAGGKGGATNWAVKGKGAAQQSWGAAAAAPKPMTVAPSWGTGAAGQGVTVAAPAKPQQPWNQGAGKGAAAGGGWKGGANNSAPAKGAGKAALGQVAAAAAVKVDPAVAGAALKAKVTSQTAALATAEKVSETTITASQAVMENDKATVGAFKASLDSLDRQITKLAELSTSITKDCEDGRKSGAINAPIVAQLGKLLVSSKQLNHKLVMQVQKLKPRHMKAEKEGELKAKEIKDNAAFKGILAKAKGEVTPVENAVNAIVRLVTPVLQKPPEGDALETKSAAIEKAAGEALTKHDAAKAAFTEHMKGLQLYAPASKTAALAALMEVQKKLTEAGNSCRVYKDFKKQMPRMIEGQKIVTEVTDKLVGHDAAITKASKMGDSSKLTKESIATIAETLAPVKEAIQEAMTIIQQKMRTVDAPTQSKLSTQKAKGEELKKKMDAVNTKIKVQKDRLTAGDATVEAQEKVTKAQESYKGCQEAEMPFLTGVEVLPDEENDAAIKACNEAMSATTKAFNAARNFVQTQMAVARSYEKDLSETTLAALTPLLAQLTEVDTKVGAFRKDLGERKIAAALTGAIDAAEACDKKVKAADKEGKGLSSKTLEDESVEDIKASIEKAKTAFTEATTAAAAAKKVLATKQSQNRAGGNHPALTKINTQLNNADTKLAALRSAMSSAEKLVKAKVALSEGEVKTTEAEAEVAKAKKLVPKEGKKLSVDGVKALDEACTAAVKSIRAVLAAVQPHLGGAPEKVKAELQKLVERRTAAQTVIDSVKADTKERRAETLTDHYIAEAETHTKAAEEAAATMEKTESPFLIGSTMALKATQELLAKCTDAGKEVSTSMLAARKYQESKTTEVRSFGEENVKKFKETCTATSERLKKVATQFATHEKDQRDRSKAARMVEAEEKVAEVEAEVEKAVAAAAPFTKEGGDKMSEADAEKPLKVYMEMEKEVSKNIAAIRRIVGERQREQKETEQVEAVKALLERVNKANDELTPAKKAAAPHEQRSLGTRLLAELKTQVGGLDAELKKATEALSPLVEHGGADFLVGASVVTLTKALQAHMKEKDVSPSDLFKEIAKGKAVSEKGFTKYLQGLAEATGHDELNAFTDERQVAMFKQIASSSKGVSAEDFEGLFKSTMTCIKATVVTDKAVVEGSETVCKVEVNTEVLLSGAQKEDAGVVRSECKVGDQVGWISVRPNAAGPPFLKRAAGSPFFAFCSVAEKAVQAASLPVSAALTSLNGKLKQGGPATEGPLKDARDEMTKLRDDISKAQKTVDELRKSFGVAKAKYIAQERTEANAHVEARNLKVAGEFLDEPNKQAAALEAEVALIEAAGAAIVSLTGEELEAFATPASVVAKVEKHYAATTEKATAAREAIKEQTKAVAAVAPQNGGTALAKTKLQELGRKVEDLAKKAPRLSGQVRSKVQAIVAPKMQTTADAIRKYAASKKMSGEELFDTLKTDDKMPEAAFVKLLSQLEEPLSAEVAKLVSQKVEKESISKDNFMKFVVLYFKVVRGIAFTDGMDISSCKTLRKCEENEVLEVLEGPVEDEKNGMTRVRAKACSEPHTVGWVTVAGSKGTAFLQKALKPAAPKPAAAPAAATEEKK